MWPPARPAAAGSDELAAQADYDSLPGSRVGQPPINASTLDELATDVVPGQSFGGLHAVERDLWAGGPLATDVAALAAQAPVAEFLLSRIASVPKPSARVAVDQLSWVVDTALPLSQEQCSHLGLVDVAATERGRRPAFEAIEPLARLVDPDADLDGGRPVRRTRPPRSPPSDRRPPRRTPPSPRRPG